MNHCPWGPIAPSIASFRKGRQYAETFMEKNIKLVAVTEDLADGMPAFLKFIEQFRGLPGTVYFAIEY